MKRERTCPPALPFLLLFVLCVGLVSTCAIVKGAIEAAVQIPAAVQARIAPADALQVADIALAMMTESLHRRDCVSVYVASSALCCCETEALIA